MSRRSALTTSTAPVAVLGTIALSLTATPAVADSTPASDRSALRGLPQAVAAATVASVVATARTTARTHTVARGDTVSAIAAAHRLRTSEVLAWNGLGWKSIIRPGDVLRLTAPAGTATAKKSSQASPSARAGSHTVRAGDTLWAIARSEGVGLAALLRANDLTASSIIFPGEKLVIPGSESAAAATSTKKTSTKKPTEKAPKAEAAPSAAAARVALDAEQIAGVKLIIAVGREKGVSDRGIAIALATAMVESWIRNLDYGTHDSLGLFQQRPSTGWGTASQIRDPRHAAAAFFGGPGDPNGTATRGLLDIPGWQSMEFGAAAQAVQISAYPHRYGRWEDQAFAWLEAYG